MVIKMNNLGYNNLHKNRQLWLFALIVLLLSFFSILLLVTVGNYNVKRYTGIAQVADVSKKCVYSSNSNNKVCYPIYIYYVNDKKYECESKIVVTDAIDKNEHSIYYDTKEPSKCSIDTTNSSNSFALVLLIIFGTIVIFTAYEFSRINNKLKLFISIDSKDKYNDSHNSNNLPVNNDQNNHIEDLPVNIDQNNQDKNIPVSTNQNNQFENILVSTNQNHQDENIPISIDHNNDFQASIDQLSSASTQTTNGIRLLASLDNDAIQDIQKDQISDEIKNDNADMQSSDNMLESDSQQIFQLPFDYELTVKPIDPNMEDKQPFSIDYVRKDNDIDTSSTLYNNNLDEEQKEVNEKVEDLFGETETENLF